MLRNHKVLELYPRIGEISEYDGNPLWDIGLDLYWGFAAGVIGLDVGFSLLPI